MGFLQDAEAIARRNRNNTVPLRELEILRDKYSMDAEAFKPIRRKSKRGFVALNDIKQYFLAFTEPLFQAAKPRQKHSGH